ncbi:membrane bound O-acyl transferase, MBOAT family protein [Magnetococcus marinus MC-1]|uniref:Probable alginate O-acetylase AlgI n=1 Tax=Magnetococcus marinus (strain ATCC BAA-1437 / JCM 17883 / MC-1) TaxID=156889 RepID=A0LC40_MAGMM|nr:MBOAT family O-acyltransferase [Magnetococcus marinus]ABK45533.1 membrane bound O-acyl transferase, MBOAT family protein [Magnetococcus marinus MC-1]
MAFTSWHYFLLLLVTLGLFHRLPAGRLRMALLVAASYLFYGVWDVRFLALILTSTVIDYITGAGLDGRMLKRGHPYLLSALPALWLAGCWLVGQPNVETPLLGAVLLTPILPWISQGLLRLPEASRKRGFLLLSIGANLTLLAFFKYFNFFIDSAQQLLATVGLGGNTWSLEILLPVGISFYTFQSLSYTIDIYRGQTRPVDDFGHFAAYVAFFPQLVAGPIERSHHLLPQLSNPAPLTPALLHEAARLLLVGYFMKLFVADNCALIANHVFASGEPINGPWALLGAVAFAFQIYGDFAGYSNIARGSSLLFGIRLSQNFAFPYLARTPSEFWRRWHITLSSWIRDYIFIPLGGSRDGRRRTLRNLSITMFLAGLWHGAAWHFVLWGLYHGALLALYRLVGPLAQLKDQAQHHRWWVNLGAWALMFGLTLVGWALFRAEDLAGFATWWLALGHWSMEGIEPIAGALKWIAAHALPLLVLQALTYKQPDECHLGALPTPLRGLVYLLLFLMITTSTQLEMEFIYFQF